MFQFLCRNASIFYAIFLTSYLFFLTNNYCITVTAICRRITKIFSGQQSFLGVRALQSTFLLQHKKKKALQELWVFPPKKLKNYILNYKFNRRWVKSWHFFLKSRQFFFNFREKAREFSLPLSSYALDLTCHQLFPYSFTFS